MDTLRVSRIASGLVALGFVFLCRGMPLSKEQGKEYAKAISYAAAGIQFFDLSNLNDRLAANGISDFDELTPSLSLGHYTVAKRLILGGNITVMLGRRSYDSNHKTCLRAGNLMMDAGFMVVRRTWGVEP